MNLPTSGPRTSARGQIQGITGYEYVQGQQQYAPQLQDARLHNQLDFSQNPQQYIQYPLNMMYNTPQQVPQQFSCAPMQRFQPRQSAADEVLSNQSSALQHYPPSMPTSVPSPMIQQYASTFYQQQIAYQSPAYAELGALPICYTVKTLEYAQSNEPDVLEPQGSENWTMEQGLLKFKGRLVVPDQDNLQTHLLEEIHRQRSMAHPGRNKTRALVISRYYWPGIARDVDRYVSNCHDCRRTHAPRDLPPGLLNPLPVPQRPWQHVSMDFQTFPKDKKGYDSVYVVVDRLGKRPYSIPCYKTTTAKDMALLYIDRVYRTHGPPDTIVSDRGPQFISSFWDEFCKILGIKLKLSTAHHPQTDGQTEITNQHISQRLRPFVNHYQDNWSELLPMMDFAAAALPQESTGLSPFQVEFGYEPRTSFDWEPRVREPVPATERLNREQAQQMARRMEEVWKFAATSMERAQARQKKQADKHRREVDFQVGDSVWVSIKPWKTDRPSRKLDFRSAGPYKILEKVGNSYRVDLPPSIKVHPVIPPDRLRKAANDAMPGQINDPPPAVVVDGDIEYEVEHLLASRISRRKLQYRAKWKGYDDDPEWYNADHFKHSPHLIKRFHEEYPDMPGPPRNLDAWIRAWEEEDDTDA